MSTGTLAGGPEKTTYSEWISSRLLVDYGTPFTFEGRPYLKKIHDLAEPKILLRCISGRMPIRLANGKEILLDDLVETRALGTEVLTFAEKRKRLSTSRIMSIHMNGRRRVGRMRLENGAELVCTPDHKVWIQDHRWIAAHRVATSRTDDKRFRRVAFIDKGALTWVFVLDWEDLGEEEVFDLSVANDYSYVAGGVLVHNCGRQVEKSSSIAAKLVAQSCLLQGYQSLYVSPSQRQTRNFSHARLEKVLVSPFVRSRFFDPKINVNDVYEKTFQNGSTILLNYASDNADRCRGISAHALYLDEIQDMTQEVFPVVEETQSHAPNPIQVYAGTPKTLNNSMEAKWKDSTQCEWLINCLGCGSWVYQDEKIVRPEGPSCPSCGRLLDPQFGRWEPYGKSDAEFLGFRIPQTMVPWIARIPSKWKSIVHKLKTFGQQEFYNEVLGLAHEKGANPLAESDLKKCCLSERGLYEFRPHDVYVEALYGGVDWGFGMGSHTVLHIVGYHSNKLHTFYIKRFAEERGDPEFQVEEIARTCQRMGVVLLACDFGGGFAQNKMLQALMAGHADVVQVQASGVKKRGIDYIPKSGIYTFNRTAAMFMLINAIKSQNVALPRWEVFQDFAQEYTCIFEDYSHTTRMIQLDHPADMPDDCFHAHLHAMLAARLARGEKTLV